MGNAIGRSFAVDLVTQVAEVHTLFLALACVFFFVCFFISITGYLSKNVHHVFVRDGSTHRVGKCHMQSVKNERSQHFK